MGRAIRARRRELGWSQQKAAAAAGMAQGVWCRLEAGAISPTVDTLDAVAKALECDAGELLKARRP